MNNKGTFFPVFVFPISRILLFRRFGCKQNIVVCMFMSLPLSVRSLFFYLFLSFCLFPFLYSVFVFVLVWFQQQTKPIQFIPNRNGKREKYLSSHILITKAECSVFNARSCRMIWRTSYALFVRFKNQWAIRRTKNPYKKN